MSDDAAGPRRRERKYGRPSGGARAAPRSGARDGWTGAGRTAPRLRPADRARTPRRACRRRFVLTRSGCSPSRSTGVRSRLRRRDRRGIGAHRRPQGVRARGRRDRARRHDGPVNMRKQNRIALWAGQRGLPLICLSDNDGGRIPDVHGLALLGAPVRLHDVPVSRPRDSRRYRAIAAVGPSFGDSALHAAMGHFVVMAKDAAIALSGPPVIAPRSARRCRRRARRPGVAADAERQRPPGGDDEDAAFAAIQRVSPTCPTRQPARPGCTRRQPERDPESCCRSCRSSRAAATTCARCSTRSSTRTASCTWRERYGAQRDLRLARMRARRSVWSPASRCSGPA